MSSNKPLWTRSAVSVLTTLALSACSDNNGSSPDVGVSVPQALLESRNIDRQTLQPVVVLSTGQVVDMQRVDEGLWSGTVQVTPNASIDVNVTWISTLAAGDVQLATLEQSLVVDVNGDALAYSSGDYDFNIDSDDDGLTNFDELEAGSDPFSAGVVQADPPPGDRPVEDTPEQDTPAEDTPAEDTPAEDTPAEDTPAEDTPAEDTPAEDTPAEDTPAEDTPAEDTPAEDTPAEDTPAEDTPEEDTPEEDTPEEDTPEEDTPAETSVDVFVPRIAQADAPVIDGANVLTDASGRFIGEWQNAVQVDGNGATLGINNLMIDLDAEAANGTPWRRWAAMHDNQYLYVLVMVEDRGQRFGDGPMFFQDDGLEVFLDGDHGRASSYGDDDDYHVIIPLLEPETTRAPNNNNVAGFTFGPFSSGTGLDLQFATGPGSGPEGINFARFEQDIYELRIDLASANIDAGAPFGFELQVNDDDNGGPRDSKWGWAHPARDADGEDVDFTTRDPSFMGTLFLD